VPLFGQYGAPCLGFGAATSHSSLIHEMYVLVAVKNVLIEDKSFRNISMFASVKGKHSRKFASIEP
jgi:hypothetical protein